MSWIIVIKTAGLGACVMLALMYLIVWSRRSRARLGFSVTMVGVPGLAMMDLGTMHTDSPEVFGRAIRWTHLVYSIGVAGRKAGEQVVFRVTEMLAIWIEKPQPVLIPTTDH